MKDLIDIIAQLLAGAIDDGQITIEDHPDWKKFKRKVKKEVRKVLKGIEGDGIEIDPADALLLLAILARFK